MNTKDIIWELMVLQDELLDKAHEYYQMFDKRGEGYSVSANAIADLVDKIKEATKCNHSAEQSNTPVVEDDNLYREVQQGLNKCNWGYKSVASGFGKGSFYIEFSNPVVENFKVHSHQYNILRNLLGYIQAKDTNLKHLMWDGFLVAYKQDNCNET